MALQVTSDNTNFLTNASRAVVRTKSGKPVIVSAYGTTIRASIGNSPYPTSWTHYTLASAGTSIISVSAAYSCIPTTNSTIHVCWMDDAGAASKLKYVKIYVSTSDVLTFDSIVTIDSDIGSDPATSSLFSAIAVDSNGYPHIAYTRFDAIMGNNYYTLNYINNVGGTYWANGVVTLISTSGTNCNNVSIILNASDLPIVCCGASTSTNYFLIGNLNNATSFTSHSIGSTTERPSIIIDESGDHYLGYGSNFKKNSHSAAWTSWTDLSSITGATNVTLVFARRKVTAVYIKSGTVYYSQYNGTSWDTEVSTGESSVTELNAKYDTWSDVNSNGGLKTIRDDVSGTNMYYSLWHTTETVQSIGTSFNALGYVTISTISFVLNKAGTPAGTINCEIYDTDTNNAPTGTALYTSSTSVSIATLTAGTPTTYNFSFTTFTKWKKFAVVLKVTYTSGGNSSSNCITFKADSEYPKQYTTVNLVEKDGAGSWVVNDVNWAVVSGDMPTNLLRWSYLGMSTIDLSFISSNNVYFYSKDISPSAAIESSSSVTGTLRAKIRIKAQISLQPVYVNQVGSSDTPIDALTTRVAFPILSKGDLELREVITDNFGSGTLTLVAEIREDNSGLPTGNLIATSTPVDWTTGMFEPSHKFPAGTYLQANKNYWFVIKASSITSGLTYFCWWIEKPFGTLTKRSTDSGSTYPFSAHLLSHKLIFNYVRGALSKKMLVATINGSSSVECRIVTTSKATINAVATVTGVLKGKGKLRGQSGHIYLGVATTTSNLTVSFRKYANIFFANGIGISKIIVKFGRSGSPNLNLKFGLYSVNQSTNEIVSLLETSSTTVAVGSLSTDGEIITVLFSGNPINSDLKIAFVWWFDNIVTLDGGNCPVMHVLSPKRYCFDLVYSDNDFASYSDTNLNSDSFEVFLNLVSGNIRAKKFAAASINTVSSVTGVLIGKYKVSATINAVTVIQGVLKGKGRLAATIGGVASVTASAVIPKSKIYATIDGVASITAIGRAKSKITGSIGRIYLPDYNSWISITDSIKQYSQPFYSNGLGISSITFKILRFNFPEGNIRFGLYSINQSDYSPISLLETSSTTVNISSIPDTYTDVTAYFSGTPINTDNKIAFVFWFESASNFNMSNGLYLAICYFNYFPIYETSNSWSSYSSYGATSFASFRVDKNYIRGNIRSRQPIISSNSGVSSVVGALSAKGRLIASISTNSSVTASAVVPTSKIYATIDGVTSTSATIKGWRRIRAVTGSTEQPTSANFSEYGIAPPTIKYGNIFISKGANICGASFFLIKQGNPVFDVTAEIWSLNQPDNNVLSLVETSTTTYAASSLTGDIYYFKFAGNYYSAEKYLVVVSFINITTHDSSNHVAVREASSGQNGMMPLYPISIEKYYNGSSWAIYNNWITQFIIHYDYVKGNIRSRQPIVSAITGQASTSMFLGAKKRGLSTIDGVCSVQAVLKGKGKILSAISPAVTTSGILKGKGRLIASISPAISVTGILKGKGRLVSSVDVSVSVTGNLKAKVFAATTISGGSSVVAAISAKNYISTQINGNSAIVAAGQYVFNVCPRFDKTTIKFDSPAWRFDMLCGSVQTISVTISGSSNIVAAAVGKGRLVGSIDSVANIQGLLSGKGKQIANINAVASTSFVLSAKGKLIASITGATSTDFKIRSFVFRLVTIDCSTTITGVLKGKGKVIAAINPVVTVTGILQGKRFAICAIDNSTAIVGVLKGRGKLISAINSATDIQGLLKAKGRPVAAINPTVTVSAVLKAKGKLIASIDSATTTDFKVSSVDKRSCIIDCNTSISAILTGKAKAIASINPVLSVTGSIQGKRKGIASIDCSTSVTGILQAKGRLISAITVAPTVQGILKGKGKILASIAPVVSVSGILKAKGKLIAAITGTTSTDFKIRSFVFRLVTMDGSTSVVAVLKGKGKTIATINAISSVSGLLQGKKYAVASVNGSTSVAALLQGRGKMISAISVSVSTTGVLKGRGRLVAAIDTSSSVTAAIFTLNSVVCSINTATSVTASLKGKISALATINGVSAIVAVAKGKGRLISSIDTLPTIQAILKAKGKLQTTISGLTAITGQIRSSALFRAEIYCSSQIGANLQGKGALVANVAASSSVIANGKAKAILATAINGSTSIVAKGKYIFGICPRFDKNVITFDSFAYTWDMLCPTTNKVVINTSSNVTGTLKGKGELSVYFDAGSAVYSDISARGKLYATISGGSTVTARVYSDKFISVEINAAGSLTATLKGRAKAIVVISGVSDVQAKTSARVKIKSDIQGITDFSGSLGGRADLKATIVSYSDVVAAIYKQGVITCGINGSTSLSPTLLAMWDKELWGFYFDSEIVRKLEFNSFIIRRNSLDLFIVRQVEFESGIVREKTIDSEIVRGLNFNSKYRVRMPETGYLKECKT